MAIDITNKNEKKIALTGTQIEETLLQAHLSKDAIAKIEGLEANSLQINKEIDRSKKTIVLLGDSITQDNLPISTDLIPAYGATGYFTWVQALSYHSFNVVNFAGISGETSTQILARVDADVLPYNPSYCMFLCGMNDSDDTDTLKANILAIYTKLKDAGIHSIILGNTPTVSESNKNLQALKVNQWLLSYFKDMPLVTIIDISRVMINPVSTTASVLTNITRDERHLSLNGAYQVGKYIYSKLINLVDKDIQYVPKSVMDNVFNNPSYSKNYYASALFSTDTDSNGLADNVSQTLSNATSVNTVENASSGFGKSQCVNVTASAAPTSLTFGYNVVMDFSTNQTVYAGDKFYAVCLIEVDSGAVNLKNINLALNFAFTTITAYDMRNVYEIFSPLVVPSGGLQFMLKTPIYKVTSTVTNFKARSVIQFTGAGNAKIRYSQLGVVKVN